MKGFFKMLLAVICGIIIMSFVGMFLISGLISAFAVSNSQSTILPKSGVLLMDMSKLHIDEQANEADPFAMIRGENTTTVGLRQAVQAINIASVDPAVKYIYLKADAAMLDLATMEELRIALGNCRMNGKPVIAYTESPTTGSYYLASIADKIYMTSHPGATITFGGVSSQLVFLKDLLDYLGVNVQLIRHGKYKSAGETFVRRESSKENLEQNQAMIDAIWRSFSEAIALSRGITEEQLDAMLNNLSLNLPQDFLENGLVDELLTSDELKSKLAALAVESSYDDVKMIPFADYVQAKVVPNLKAKKKIAIIYADGEIVDGAQKGEVAGDRFASMISKVRADSTVEAVVLRVNSPGGSVLASDKIKSELDLLKEQKPLIASYGGYAASGGYWISNNCDHIFADNVTLTGSIGVFSMIPDFSGTAKKIAKVNVTAVNSHKHSDMYTLMRPLDAVETKYMQESVDYIYESFVGTVAQGRSLDPDYVDSIAQGRVWTGSEALEIGLIDEIGTLEDAINYAIAATASPSSIVDDWNIVEYPRPASSWDSVLEYLGSGSSDETVFSGTPFEGTARTMMEVCNTKTASGYIFARIPYAIDIR